MTSPDRLKEIELEWGGMQELNPRAIDWLIAEIKRLRTESGIKDFETPTYTTDRFLSIKSMMAAMTDAGCLAKNSALQWLVDEVHRLRVFKNNVPVSEIDLVIQHTDYGNIEVTSAIKFISLWQKWVNNHA